MSANRSPAPQKLDKAPPDPAQEELYRLRNTVLRKLARLDRKSLRWLVETLDAITDADARKIAAYASALAEWPDPEASSR